MLDRIYAEFATKKTVELLAIDSPSGYTEAAANWVRDEFAAMGFKAWITEKGGVMIDLGGEDVNDGLMLAAHVDTLGGMVAEVKGNGRLRITNLGGMSANNGEAENVRVHTRAGKVIEGTLQLINASTHVNRDYSSTPRTFDTTEVVLDEDVKSAADTRALGIEVGDFVCFDPRTRITESGYIKSRYLDDKLSAAILLGFTKYLVDNNIKTDRHIYIHFTTYEEVGHGAAGICPAGVTEIFGVDMGCVGNGLTCTEREVSICAADGSGPYDYDINCKLVELAKKHDIGYAVDMYIMYSSDCSVAVRNFDLRHALIGAGVYASHGYERSHVDGVLNTMKLLAAYLCEEQYPNE